jgi:hypothetical protein
VPHEQTEDFLAATMARLREAETALHRGDAGPRSDVVHEDSVTLFGAALAAQAGRRSGRSSSASGVVLRLRRSRTRSSPLEPVETSPTVAYEHTTASLHGGGPTPYVLRATGVPREDGEWKVVHRHADPLASLAAPASSSSYSQPGPRPHEPNP